MTYPHYSLFFRAFLFFGGRAQEEISSSFTLSLAILKSVLYPRHPDFLEQKMVYLKCKILVVDMFIDIGALLLTSTLRGQSYNIHIYDV